MNNQNTNFTDHLKNHLNSNSGKKLKTAANVFLFLGILAGLILGITMFNKAGESKD